MRWPVVLCVLWAAASPAVSATGGARWTRVACPVTDSLHNGFFVDGAHGWIVSYGTGVVLGTQDGGQSWFVASRLDSIYYESMCFLDPSNGWLCGEGGTLLRTTDGGKTWTRSETVPPEAAYYGVRFRDGRHGFLAGGDTRSRRGVVLETRDGGLTWGAVSDGIPQGFFESIRFVGESTGFIGGGRFILRTGDGGRTWKAADIGEDVVVRGIHFIDATNGWAVGHGGAVFRTEDGGASWARIGPFTRNRLRTVFFVDDREGFIAGDADEEAGSLWRTTDGGETWTAVSGELPGLHRLFAGPGGPWAVGKSGTILKLEAAARERAEEQQQELRE